MSENQVRLNKNALKYIIGIDFGHGETSADICDIQWDDNAAQLAPPESIQIFDNTESIPSVLLIEQIAGKDSFYIGQQAIRKYRRRNTSNAAYQFYSYFKKVPSSMKSEDKLVVKTFMREVYNQIRRQRGELTDDNHLVFIACPSNAEKWTDKELHAYSDIAKEAGLPIPVINSNEQYMGIIRESRAAFIKARRNPNAKTSIKEGLLLIDFGSSTVDLTYYASRYTAKPIDGGGDCGASAVELNIADDLEKEDSSIHDILKTYPDSRTSYNLAIRQAKEQFFTYEGEDMEIYVNKQQLTGGREKGSIEEFYSINKINSILSRAGYKTLDGYKDDISYKDSIKQCFKDFRDNKIKGMPIKLIFLTGGASRMNFIQDIAKDVFSYDGEFYRETNPSITISNGIALAGRADLRTIAMEDKLLASPAMTEPNISPEVADKAALALAKHFIDLTDKCYSNFSGREDKCSLQDLENSINYEFKRVDSNQIVNNAYAIVLKEVANKKIIPKINFIVRDYFPDFIIKDIDPKSSFSSDVSTDKLNDIIKKSLDNITEGLLEGLAKLAFNIYIGTYAIVWGVLYNAGILVKNFFSKKQTEYLDISEMVENVTISFRDKNTLLSSRKRRKVYNKFKEMKQDYAKSISQDIKSKLLANTTWTAAIDAKGHAEIARYIHEQINNARIMLN